MSDDNAADTGVAAETPATGPRNGGVTARVVAKAEDGWRFDRWVKQHFPNMPFGQMQKLSRTGQFRLDGKRVSGEDRIVAGQTVRIPPIQAAPLAPVGRPSKPALDERDAAFVRSLVLYEDARCIVFNKPAGLAVQGGSGTTRHLDGMLDAFIGKSGERPRLVHRLDRDTSGLLVVGKTAESTRELAFAFQQHRVRKLYWAILIKGPPRDDGRIDLPIGKTGAAGKEKVEVDPEGGGQFARTAFKVIARAGKIACWTALLPLTGRTHQLRAHCAAIEAPILGDGKYGGRTAHPDGAPKGLMLHAREIEIEIARGKFLNLKAEPPRSFKEGLAWLGLTDPELPGSLLADWPA